MSASDKLGEVINHDECSKMDTHDDNDTLENEQYDDDNDDYYDDDHNNNYICDSDDDGGGGGGVDDEDEADDLYAHDPEHFEYECLPLNKIDTITEKKCQRLVDALRLDDNLDAVYLLKQFKWNCARIIEMYTKDNQGFVSTYFSDDNNNNSNKTLNNCANKTHLSSYLNIFGSSTPAVKTTKSVHPSNQESFCQICYRHLGADNDQMLALDECGHEFCVECWCAHFESVLNSAYTSAAFECMQTKCKVIADKEFVLKCLAWSSSDETALKYRVLLAKDLVKESEDLQLCPGEKDESEPATAFNYAGTPRSVPSSNNIRLVSTISSTPTISFSYVRNAAGQTTRTASTPTSTPTTSKGCMKKCAYIVWAKSKPAARKVVCTSCKNQYCFKCQLPYHAPNACETIRKWNTKCQDDSETRNYLLVHTQDCPKCKVCIEKNGGCSHMTCNRCKHEFCWVCSNDWKTHGATYDCNRYKGNPEQDNAREALNRYTHYYHRWINHANSLKFEKALREQCAVKIHEKIMSRCGGGTLVDWEFLTEAVEVLTRARYTLQYTYPYAYFLNGPNEEEKLLFENIQAELEREVENLSHSVEKVSLNDKYNIRIQMSIVEKRRKTLLKDFIK